MWSCTCAKILAYVMYLGKYRKAYIRRYTFYLVIFLTILPKLVLIEIEWKIVNSGKSNIEVSLKKFHALTLRIYFKNYTVWRECNALLCSHFWYHSFIFPILQNFIEIHQVSRKMWIFTSLILTVFVNFFYFFWPLLATKKTNNASIYKIISAFFLTWNCFR